MYGAISHNPWGAPKPICPSCLSRMGVQARAKGRDSVRWSCVCGMISDGSTSRPSWAVKVQAKWLNDMYTLPYPIPEIEGISWKKL